MHEGQVLHVEWDDVMYLLKGYNWDWVYFNVHSDELRGKLHNSVTVTCEFRGLGISGKIQPTVAVTDFFWEVFSILVGFVEDNDCTLVKEPDRDKRITMRLYREDYKVPSHIAAKGVFYPWD